MGSLGSFVYYRVVKPLRVLSIPAMRRALFGLRVMGGVEHLPFLSLRPFPALVDAGANRGQFALAFRHANPASMIHAFEPLKGPAAVLGRVFAADPRMRVSQVALGAEPSETSINVSRKDASSSLLPITQTQVSMAPGTEHSHTETIQVTTLPLAMAGHVLPEGSLMKIDVQGYELEVLKGAVPLFPRLSDIYCECSFDEFYGGQALAHQVIDWLHQHAYRLAGVYNLTYADDGRAVQADFHFRRVDEREAQ
jgi:FkbM family methyltransferase